MGETTTVAMSTPSALVIGTGMIGAEVVRQLREKGVKVFTADIQEGRGDFHVDLSDIASIAKLDQSLPDGVDHVLVCAGHSSFGDVTKFDAASWTKNFESKLIPMSRLAVMLINNKEVHILKDNGSITITSGLAARTMNSNWPGISANCAGLDAFVHCAGVNTPRGQGTTGTVPKAVVCAMYVESAMGTQTANVWAGLAPGADPTAPKAFNSKVFDFIHQNDKSKL